MNIAIRMATVGVAATALSIVVSLSTGHSLGTTVELFSITFGAAAVALGTAWVLTSWFRLSLSSQLVLIVLNCTVGIGLGVWFAARRMFVSSTDLSTLVVILVGGAAASILAAIVLGYRVDRATRHLVQRAATIEGPDRIPDHHVPGIPIELARISEQLERTRLRLGEAQRERDETEAARRELVAWVSHDLRTPLAGIRAMSEALADGVVTDPVTADDYHHRTVLEVDRLSDLVDDLFELSRIDADAVTLTPTSVALSDLISDAIASAEPLAAAGGVAIEGSCMTPSPIVEVSVPEMGRALRNLMDNALRHTPRGGSVRIDATRSDDGICISVTDSCGGISETDLPRVFERAYSGDPARTPAENRTGGLGLAIAEGLVTAHNGTMAVRNVDGGCRFSINLAV
jgi:signal transduction histidine kinase